MSSADKNLNQVGEIPKATGFKFAIVVSAWNSEITEALYNGAFQTLIAQDCATANIDRINVPGSFELTTGAALVAAKKKYDAIICLGCVIQGETRHFDFICSAVANGLTTISLTEKLPVIFGVLTTNNMQQARDRSGGQHGNKGIEAAATAIQMAALSHSLK